MKIKFNIMISELKTSCTPGAYALKIPQCPARPKFYLFQVHMRCFPARCLMGENIINMVDIFEC